MARKIDNPAQSKLRFFVFQDIITCVTGVLIFIVLLMTVNIGSITGTGGGSKLALELASLLDQLKTLDDSITGLQDTTDKLDALPDAASLKASIAALKQDVQAQEEKSMVLNQQIRDLEKKGDTTESKLGLDELRDQINKLNEDIDKIRAQNDENTHKVADTEAQVKAAESGLLDEKNNSQKLWVIPETSETTKEPVLVILSGRAITMERFSAKTAPVVLTDSEWTDEFQQALKSFDHTRQYMVVFLKPTGITRFKPLLNIIKKAEFEVGYDTLEEAEDIHFSHPKTTP